MATTTAWDCKTVDVHPTEGSNADVVYNVHWIVTGTSSEKDPDGNFWQAYNIGTQVVPAPTGTFIPFADLTETNVEAWTKTAMGETQVTSIEANIATSINLLINPTTVTLTVGEPVPPEGE